MTTDELIKIYMDRFINRIDIWGKQWVNLYSGEYGYACQKSDMDTKGGKYLYEPVTSGLVKRHLVGKITCAWYAIDENYRSKWLCFDSDLEDGDLDKLEIALKSWGLHTIREGRRPGRAGHLWVLFDQPVKANLLIILGDAIMKLAGVRPASKNYPHGIERFPKSATGLSQVRVLGTNLKPEANGAQAWFDGVEQNVKAQLEWLAAQPLNRAEDAIREAEKYMTKLKRVAKTDHRKKHRYGGSRLVSMNILDYVNYRRVGNSLVTQCPLCADEGHDKHQDNLHISPDSMKFCCVYDGPGQVHKAFDIVTILKQRKPN